MKTIILSVGTELLFGQTVNTNAAYLSEKLNMLGFDVMAHYTIGDNPKRLEQMINLAFEDCDYIITTGGLGSTQDDLTKEVVTETLNDKLIMNEAVLENLEKYFESRKRKMTENNRKQALVPSRGRIFYNNVGTAPGFLLEKDGKNVICLPGPPKEMKGMFESGVMPYLAEIADNAIHYKILKFFSVGESALETDLIDLIDKQTDPTLATYAKEGEVAVRVTSKRKTKEEAKNAVDEMIRVIKDRLGDKIYSYDDETLPEVVTKKLIQDNLTISTAESCTGGMLASKLVDSEGISKCFDRGFVTYSNDAKMSELGVKAETLEKFGAVSEEVALEMVEGLKEKTGSDICISITGVAGPENESETKPAGLSYIGLIYGEKKFCKKITTMKKERNWNRNYTTLCAFEFINKIW